MHESVSLVEDKIKSTNDTMKIVQSDLGLLNELIKMARIPGSLL